MMRNELAARRSVALAEWLAVAAILVAAAGCSGSGLVPGAAGPPQGVSLGPLPDDSGPGRTGSVLTVNTINGADTYLRSNPANVVDAGTAVMINVSGGVQWAMYQFSPGGNPLTHLKVFLTEQQGNMRTWVAVSDYGHLHWAWYGPYHTGPADIDLTGGTWTGAGGSMYFAVLAHTGALVQVTKSEVTVDVAVAAATYTGNTKVVFDTNCISCHGSPSGTAGIVLDNYTDAAANASLAATKVADGSHPPTGALPQATRDLLKSWSDGGAPLGPATRYSTDTGPMIYSAHCVTCHSAYSTFAGAKADAKTANDRVQAGTMPPASGGGPLSAALKTMMQDWINDGWPN